MRHRLVSGELLLAVGIVLLGLLFVAGTLAIPVTEAYERVGPAAYPWAISVALIVIGLILVREALRGVSTDTDVPRMQLLPVAYISLGLILHILLIERAGFIIASAILFFCAARAFGARSRIVTACIAVALAAAVYFAFSLGLDLPLPPGILLRIG